MTVAEMETKYKESRKPKKKSRATMCRGGCGKMSMYRTAGKLCMACHEYRKLLEQMGKWE